MKQGAFRAAARKFKRATSTVTLTWARWCKYATVPLGEFPYIEDGRKNNGRPIFYDRTELRASLQEMKYSARTTLREIAGKLGISPSTVHKLCVEEHLIQPHHN